MLKARQKGRFITHIHIYTNTPMQAVRRLETVESSPALTHSFALHDRRFITAMYAISLAHTPAQTVFGVALGWVSGRSVVRLCESEQASAAAVTHTLFDWVFYFLFGFPCLEQQQQQQQLNTATFCIQSFLSLCASRTCWSWCCRTGYPLCVCVVSLAGCVSVCVWVLVKSYSELKFKSMRWIISFYWTNNSEARNHN